MKPHSKIFSSGWQKILILGIIFLSYNLPYALAEDATPDVDLGSQPSPKISTVQMKIVPQSQWVLIVKGSNFGNQKGELILNEIKLEATLWTDTEIQALAEVGTDGGILGITTTSRRSTEIEFSLDISPTITRITPATAYSGELLTITGYDFGTQPGTIFIGNQKISTITSWKDYEVKSVIPEGISAGKLEIKVITFKNESSNGLAISFIERPAPKIQYLFPANGYVDELIDINGQYFTANEGKIILGNIEITPQSWQDTLITFKVPKDAVNGNLSLIVGGKKSNQIPFNINQLPEINTIEPLSIIPGKTKVTIKGSGFLDAWYIGSNIYFNGIASDAILDWTDTKIIVIPPKNITPGAISLKIMRVADLIIGPDYRLKTEVSYLSPEAGKAGDTVEIFGLNFGAQTGSVNLNGLIQKIISWQDTKITIQITEKSKSGTLKIIKADGSESEDFELQILESISKDSYSHKQWYLDKVKAVDSWPENIEKNNVIVAVIDDGIDTNHPDLTTNIWTNSGEIPGNFVDDDENGFVDDLHGWNFVDDSNEMTPKGQHGTMVGGIIGAVGGNSIGIAGINWKVKLMPLIACQEGECASFKISDAIRYATDNGAQIINLSLGGAHFTNTYVDEYDEAIAYAFNKGVLIVSSAGNGDLISNEGRNLNLSPSSPACNDNEKNMVIGVAALDKNDKKTNWSDYGSNCVDISAPGLDIFSTVPPAFDPKFNPSEDIVKFGYDEGSGTSFSAPIVSGAAAFLKALHPDWSHVEIREALIKNADNIDGVNPNFAGQLGGRLNLLNAIKGKKPDVVFESDQKNSGRETSPDNNKNNSETIIQSTFGSLRASEVLEAKFNLIWNIPADLSNVSHYVIYSKTDIDDKWLPFSDASGNPILYAPNTYSLEVFIRFQLKYTYRVDLIEKNGSPGGSLILEMNLRPIPEKFADLAPTHKNGIAINFLKNRRILEGYPDGSFRAENPVNRAELLKILIASKGINPDYHKYRNCFPDVAEEWFARFVCYAKDQKWIEGYPDGTFRPGQQVNKVEAIKMLINTQGILIPFTINQRPFEDTPTTVWFTPYIEAAKEKNLLEENGALFAPDNLMVRSGISENIYRTIVIKELGESRYAQTLDSKIK